MKYSLNDKATEKLKYEQFNTRNEAKFFIFLQEQFGMYFYTV